MTPARRSRIEGGSRERRCLVAWPWSSRAVVQEARAVSGGRCLPWLEAGGGSVLACAVLRVIGWVNFLDDSSGKPYMKLTAIDKAFGVAESTGQGKAKAIRDLLKIRQFDFHWMLRRRVEENPMAWMISVNGFMLDARHLRREVQEEAFQKGLIPYIPGKRPGVEKADDEEKGSHL